MCRYGAAVLKRWAAGETQVVVGTHILLNLQQEMYGKLKLLIIDEVGAVQAQSSCDPQLQSVWFQPLKL